MAVQELIIPDIGDFDAVDVIEVLISPGDAVEAEQSLITLESDKATMEVPAPANGVVEEVRIKVGDKVKQGDIIGLLNAAEAGAAAQEPKPEQPAPAPAAAPAEPPPAPAPAKPSTPPQAERPAPAEAIDTPRHKLAHASPAVRQYARELGVDLSHVQGSGRKGRIVREDVNAFVKSALSGTVQPGAATGAGGAGIPPIPAVDFSRFGETETVPLSRIRKLSGAHLQRSWLNVPHVTQFDEADITELEAFRKAQKQAAEAEGVKLTPLAFLVKASAAALKAFPEFNSSLSPEGDALILKKYVNIGVAVDTPNGLVVPVVRDAERKGVYDIARELAELSARARDGKLAPGDMQGGCFSISSLGGIGGTAFTPIVNAPEVAILGVSRSAIKPVWDGNAFQPRLMLPLSLSYDHRVIDGAAAARFTTYLAGVLSDIRKLLL